MSIIDSTYLNVTKEEAKLDGEGYEKYYDNLDSENVQDDSTAIADKNSSGEKLQISGESLDEFSKVYGGGPKIIAMPLHFSPLDDPYYRVYNKTYLSDGLIIYFNVGLPKLNKKLSNLNTAAKSDAFGSGALDIVLTGVTKGKDFRFINFKPSFKEYFYYVTTACNYVHAQMGLEGFFDFYEQYGQDKGIYGMPFYCSKGTTVSEGFSNEYGDTSLVQEANGKAQESREKRQMTALYGAGGLALTLITSIKASIADILSNAPIIGKVASVFANTINGSQLYYPKIWSNSNMSRSYSIEIKLYSPYGNKKSIFDNVYFPFLCLLTMAMPRADGIYGYKEPFLVRADCPGWFLIECGVITNFTFTKGGDERMWTTEGFPNEIVIQLELEDLYPQMFSSRKIGKLRYNWSFMCFLQNMSGLEFEKLSISVLTSSIKAKLKMFVSSANQVLSLYSLHNRYKDMTANLASWIRK